MHGQQNIKKKLNEHVVVLPTGTIYWMNHVLKNDKVSFCTQKHSVTKLLPNIHLIDVLSRLKSLNAITVFKPLRAFLI